MLIKLIEFFFKDKKFLICFGAFAILLLIASLMDIFYTFFIPPIAFILALGARAIWAAISSVKTVATSGARVQRLAGKYPQLVEFEKRRSKFVSLRLFLVISVIVAVVAIPTAIYHYVEEILYEDGGIPALISVAVVLFISLITYFIIINPRKSALNDEYKKYAVLEELCLAFNNVNYKPYECIPQIEIDSLKLFRRYDLMTGNDLFEAERGGILFSRSDLNLSVERNKEDKDGNINKSYVKVFGGSVFKFNSGENYPLRLQIISEGFPHVQGSGVLDKLLRRANENTVETEMDEFNRMFNVYCEDQTVARMILTPQVIDGINRFGKFIRYPIAVIFDKQYIYLLLSTPGIDSFEVCLAGSKSVEQQQETIIAQTTFIVSIVDNIYLQNRPRFYSDRMITTTPDTGSLY